MISEIFYSLPLWATMLLFLILFNAFNLIGKRLTLKFLEKHFGKNGKNELVGLYLGLFAAFYGILLGMVTVGAWENFTEASNAVVNEASAVSTLKRDLEIIEQGEKKPITGELKNYLNEVINVSWPMMQLGKIPHGDGKIISNLQFELYKFNPEGETNLSFFEKALESLGDLEKARKERMGIIHLSIPWPIWVVVVLGALLTIAMSWLIAFESRVSGVILSLFIGTLFAMLIFLAASLDQPMRGELSIGTGPYVEELNNIK